VSGTAPATLSVSVNPVKLSAGTYSATVRISATGATGSPASIFVKLVVQTAQPTVNIASLLNGASFQAGFASATWVSIFGTNLSQTTRTWQAGDFVGGMLPVALDGVSVMIDGLPAYVYYISPTQLNVLAPDDATVGAVQFQVTTAQGKSNIFTAQKQQFAPAFFPWPNGQPVATHLDYGWAAKSGTFAGATTVPAKPGEYIILWGTGFGPTNPATPTGVTIPASTTYYAANPVYVTIGSLSASVYGTALASGSAGLYQVVAMVPATLSNGDYALVATVGGVPTATTTLTVHN
jgi:uncharacterized protein (TIGR03437 family)